MISHANCKERTVSNSTDVIHEETERRRIVNRLKRLEGQIRGLQTMIESGKNCEAVLTQIMAAKSALNQVGLHIIGHAMKGCMIGDEDISRDDLIDQTFDVLKRYRLVAAANTPIGDKTPALQVHRSPRTALRWRQERNPSAGPGALRAHAIPASISSAVFAAWYSSYGSRCAITSTTPGKRSQIARSTSSATS